MLVEGTMGISAALLVFNQPAQAMPMVSTEEFETLVRDAARSVQIVEFTGTAGQIVTVRLVDGTVFGISDVVESAVDPRSPLKVRAVCRQYGVPTKFLAYDAILATTPKKKKVYMNKIVQKAAERNEVKKERMRQDEEERLAEVYKLEEEAAKRQVRLQEKAAERERLVQAEEAERQRLVKEEEAKRQLQPQE